MANMRNRTEYKQAMQLEEARKAGLAPAAVDEDGKEINPHIPQFMSSAPWYLNQHHPSLKHQKAWKPPEEDSKEWYDRGAKTFQAQKYRKGACANCGAMTHKTKDCLERPRKKGAKLTGKNIAADEKVQNFQLTFEGKRDRWNGYDAKEYDKVYARYDKIEAAKQKKAKELELEAKFQTDGAGASGAGGAADDAKLGEGEDAGFAKVKKRVASAGGGSTGSVRNLRIREDTAKYLLNLKADSAYYDPKSRSMRADPNPDMDPAKKKFAGDMANLAAGEYGEWQKAVVHHTAKDGQALNMHSNPSAAEKLFQEMKAKKEKLNSSNKTSIMDKYGNAAAPLAEGDRKLLMGQTEAWVEYDRAGRLVKGAEEPLALSKYEENVLVNNHTAVWGSYWHDGLWGYKCCHSHVKNSYCTGAAGVEAQAARAQAADPAVFAATRAPPAATEGAGAPERKADLWGADGGAQDLDEGKVREALERLEGAAAAGAETDERKRGFNSLGANAEVTAEEMEAWRLKRARADDPLNKVKEGEPAAGDGDGGAGGGAGGYDYV